jgi:uncharacterized protein YwgA
MGNVEQLVQCLKDLGIELKLDDFSERKRIQKTVCLLQYVFGIPLGFSFSWYIHGPYSPDLTRTLFELSEKGFKERGNVPLTRKEKERISEFKEFLGDSLKSSEEVELIGSLYYLYYLGKTKANASDEQILATFKAKKPFFSNVAIEKAWEKRTQVDRLLARRSDISSS